MRISNRASRFSFFLGLVLTAYCSRFTLDLPPLITILYRLWRAKSRPRT